VEGIPVFESWEQAASEVQPNTAMIFVPPRFAADSILEAAAAGVELVIAITEGIPAHDELRVYNTLKRDHPGTRLVGPNCPGILSPGKANVGIIPASFFKEGNVGVVSRSGTLTYQIGNEIAQAGFGCSSIVGIGGDPVPGSSFVDIIELFQEDAQTELIVLSGEIGGSAEEEAAEYVSESVSKPVVAYIAGFTAPAGKQMGHAGAIVSGSAGTAAAKALAFEAKGVRVGRTPTEVAEIAIEILGGVTADQRSAGSTIGQQLR
jgi:succinyl-CoA synthetase alpha subunit